MDLRNCKMCGNMYQHTSIPYCPSCHKKWDEMFVKVREYIWENPDANVAKVSKETGVEEKYILEFLREGRIELRKASAGLPCERCGVPIKVGRYCNKCSKELERELRKGLSTAPKDFSSTDGERLHILDRVKKRKKF